MVVTLHDDLKTDLDSGKGTSDAQAFMDLLEEFKPQMPRRGQYIKGEVLRIDDDTILMDVGSKRDAVVAPREMDKLDREVLEKIVVGDKLQVFVLRTPMGSDRLLVSIERGLEQIDWDRASELLTSNEIAELEISGMNKGGLEVAFGRLRGFVPNSHLPGLPRGAGMEKITWFKEESIGESMLFKVIEVNQTKRRLILSAREAHAEARAKRLRELEPGSIVSGHVVNLVDFGAFVSLGGVDGLVHISEIDHSHLSEPGEALEVGEEVRVKVLNIDIERERISLSIKALLPSPWDNLEARYAVGDLVEGQVTNVRDFGAFIMLNDGIEGLIHASEIDASSTGRPQDVVTKGDRVLAKVTRIEPDRRRIGLSLRQVSYDEQLLWMERSLAKATETELDVELNGPPIDSGQDENQTPL